MELLCKCRQTVKMQPGSGGKSAIMTVDQPQSTDIGAFETRGGAIIEELD
jgi:hypothetical protein